MPDFALNQIFGTSSELVNSGGLIQFHIGDFENSPDGDINNDLGLDSSISLIDPISSNLIEGKATVLFYCLMLKIMQNQATGKNDDPEQKIYIQPSGVSVVTAGSRQGQLERRFTVSIFSGGGIGNVADIDEI